VARAVARRRRVLAAHGALDDRFAIGPNSEVPAALGLDVDAEPLRRDGTAIGVVARLPEAARLGDVAGRVEAELGGLKARLGDGPKAVEAVAFAGAMTAELVGDAAARGALLYVTGQIRRPAIEAVHRCGVRALAVGQGRAEAWGLRRLGALVRERWPGVEVVDAGRTGR